MKIKVLDCHHNLDHDGKHDCKLKDHQCINKCIFSDKENCNIKCKKKIGHSEWNGHDDECLCDSKSHWCNDHCDAPNCNGKCKLFVI